MLVVLPLCKLTLRHTCVRATKYFGCGPREAVQSAAILQVTFLEGASGLLACRAVLAHMNHDQSALDRYVQVRSRGQESQTPCVHKRKGLALLCLCWLVCHIHEHACSNKQAYYIDAEPPSTPLCWGCCVQELLGLWESHICEVLPDGECELLYGRAGYLYSLTWLQKQLGKDSVPQPLIKVWFVCVAKSGYDGNVCTGVVAASCSAFSLGVPANAVLKDIPDQHLARDY